MKKIISILLALTFVFALFACANTCETCVDENKDALCDVCGGFVKCETCVDENSDAKCDICRSDVPCVTCVDVNRNGACDICGKVVVVKEFEDFEAALAATDPTEVIGTITLNTAAGKMVGEYTATVADDGSVTVNYSFDSFNSIAVGGANDVTSKITGSVTRKADGTYTYTGDVVEAAESVAGSVTSIKFDKSLMTYNIAGGTISAVVSSANTEAVLGVALESDATFALIINDGKVVSFSLSYALENADVTVVCEYK